MPEFKSAKEEFDYLHMKMVQLRRELTNEGSARFVNVPRNKDFTTRLNIAELNEAQQDPCKLYGMLREKRKEALSRFAKEIRDYQFIRNLPKEESEELEEKIESQKYCPMGYNIEINIDEYGEECCESPYESGDSAYENCQSCKYNPANHI